MKVYTVREAAKILRLHWNTVYLMIRHGRLKSVRTNGTEGKIMIPDWAIEEFLGKKD